MFNKFLTGLTLLALGLSAFARPTAADEGSALEITDTLPAHGSQDVFLNSGIELTFNSDTVAPDALKASLTVSPSIEFYVQDGDADNTLVVCPYGEYEPETKYTVTVGAGLTAEDGMVLKEDVVFSFNTASEDLAAYTQGVQLAPAGQGSVVNSLTDEIPAAFLLISEDLVKDFSGGAPEADVTLYGFESDEAFLKALVQQAADRESRTSRPEQDPSRGRGLVQKASFNIKAEEVTDTYYWWWRYKNYILSLPESLPEGKYLAKLDFPVRTKHQDVTVTKYLLLQSTELSAYVMTSGNNAVAWLHNGITSRPVDGAEVSLYDNSSYYKGTTVEDGTARLEEGSAADLLHVLQTSVRFPHSGKILSIRAGEHSFIEMLSDNVLYTGYSDYYGNPVNRQYYTYLYTDRQIYSTTDTVHFFGVIKPRHPETAVPETLTVSLTQGWWNNDEIVSATITPDEKGCFSGELAFEDQKDVNYASLSVSDESGTALMTSDGFTIQDYVKPAYTWESSVDKPVYVLGKEKDDTAVVSIDISYFDQTPAADFGLKQEWHDNCLVPSQNEYKADQSGHIEDAVKLTSADLPDTWQPQTVTLSYQSGDIEDEKLYINQELVIIPRDVMILAENDPETETLKVNTYAVDVSKIKERSDLYDQENLKGEGVSATVTGTLYKCWYEKVSEGTRYDYIYKRSYEAYHYDYHKDAVDVCVIMTKDGEGSYTYHIEQDEENPACYYMELSVKDSADRNVTCTAGISYRSLARYINVSIGDPVYRLKSSAEGTEVPDDPDFWAWYYNPDGKFSESAPAEFVLVRDNEEFEIPEGGDLLSAALTEDFSMIETGAASERTVGFSEDLLPNYSMVGAYFDGRNAWPLTSTSMVFDYETRELEIRLTPDKEEYRPGDTVTVTADILRKSDQTPAAEGTRVALSAVDEAIFALQEQDIQILSRLYGRFWNNYSQYSSRNTLSPSEAGNDMKMVEEEMDMPAEAPAPMAETSAALADTGRKMEPEHIRSDFRDAAYFAYASADEDGKAQFTFTIPDNMTSWRLSVIAVTDDVWAGNAKSDIICTRPYYTVPVINDIMLEGEDFSIGLRSAGTLEDAGECTYEVSVRPSDSEEAVLEGTASAKALRDYTWVTLDGLAEGSYIVRITGKCGEYTDVSEYPFDVVRSGLEAYASLSFPVSDRKEFHPLRYPVQVMLYDKDAYVYNAVLSRLLCSRDIRADERLGAHYALGVLADSGEAYFDDLLEDHDISDLVYIFPQFAYGKNNAEISALAYLAVPELLNSGVIGGIVPEDIAQNMDSPFTGSPYAAYLLQALAGDAFSTDPAGLLEDGSLSFRDRIYLMAALFVSGREDEARAAYEAAVEGRFESSEAVSGEVVYWLNVDEGTTVQDDTAAALIMASLLHSEEARGMALYLVEKPSDRNIYPLEEVLYLKNCDEKDAGECTVSYVLDGETFTETLTRNRRITLSLQKKALEELQLTAVSGEPYMTVFYIAGLDELNDESTRKLSATVTLDKESYRPGDEARITVVPEIGTLDPSIGCSTMILDVCLPTGMRFERYTPNQNQGYHWYLVSRQGQRLRFIIFDSSEKKSGVFVPVTFTASCVTPGEFIVESVYLSSNHYDTWGLSARGKVTVTAE